MWSSIFRQPHFWGLKLFNDYNLPLSQKWFLTFCRSQRDCISINRFIIRQNDHMCQELFFFWAPFFSSTLPLFFLFFWLWTQASVSLYLLHCGTCLCLSRTAYLSVGTPTITTIPAPSHLHSGWIREWSVRGHGLIVQPKNSPRLSPLWAFHLGSFIGPVQHFPSCVAMVLGYVGMALILTRTQKHENRTEGGHCTWRRVGKVAEEVCERWARMSYAKCNLRKWVRLKQKMKGVKKRYICGHKHEITFFLN